MKKLLCITVLTASLFANETNLDMAWIALNNNDAEKAFLYFKLSAMEGNAIGKFNLGLSYLYGDGVEKNYYEAVKWIKESADQGEVSAQNKLKVICKQLSHICYK